MTKLTADETCVACGGLLVPPELAFLLATPQGSDYVCLNCGRPYQWTTDNPPRLTLMVVAERHDESDDED